MKVSVKDMETSQSRIATYKLCPRKFKYRYIDHLPVIKTWPHLVKGNFAHDVLEVWTKKIIKDPNLDIVQAMKESYRALRDSPEYQTLCIDKYLNEIKPWLKKFLEDYRYRRFTPIAAEQEIKFKYRGIIVTGRIDRIDRVGPNTIKIVDYKTTKDPKYLTHLQLGMYHVAVKYGSLSKQFGDCDIETAYVLLRHDMREEPYTFKVSDLDACLDEIEDVVSQISADKTWEPRTSHMCQYCDYFVTCTKEQDQGGW
jgi:RecB family exonuclease